MKFDICFQMVIKHEGGFVAHPSDPGGITNLGVTKAAWEEYLGKEVTEQDMRDLTVETVKPFYRKNYWDRVRGDDLPPGVDYAVFDFAVNSGVSRAARTLQECVGATKDGSIGPKTVEAVKARNAAELAQEVCDKRLEFLQSLPHFPTFARGWTRRVLEVAKTAAELSR
jgi:lysozyme family protein